MHKQANRIKLKDDSLNCTLWFAAPVPKSPNVTERKKCLIFLRYYLPGFQSGGPVRSVSNLVDVIGDRFDFYIVTSNRDFLKEEPYDCVEAGWNVVGQAKFFIWNRIVWASVWCAAGCGSKAGGDLSEQLF